MSNIEAITSPVSVEHGGTGAIDAASARKNIHAMTDYEIINNVDLDTFVTPGFYHSNTWISYPAAHSDAQGTVINISYMQANNINSAWTKQIFISPHDGKMWWRNHNNATWLTDWQSMPFSSVPMTFSVNSSGGLRVTY